MTIVIEEGLTISKQTIVTLTNVQSFKKSTTTVPAEKQQFQPFPYFK